MCHISSNVNAEVQSHALEFVGEPRRRAQSPSTRASKNISHKSIRTKKRPKRYLHSCDRAPPCRSRSSSTSDIQPADGAFPRPTSSPPPELLHTRPPPRRRSFSLTLPTTELLLPNTRRSSGTGRLVGGRRRPRHRGFVCLGLPKDEDVEGSPSSKEDHAAGDSH
jgi:hypothetical protein